MNKIILLMLFVVGLTMNSKAQVDFFFSYRYDREENEWKEYVLLPNKHGLDYDYSADDVSLGAGLIFMVGFGLVYAKCRKKEL